MSQVFGASNSMEEIHEDQLVVDVQQLINTLPYCFKDAETIYQDLGSSYDGLTVEEVFSRSDIEFRFRRGKGS